MKRGRLLAVLPILIVALFAPMAVFADQATTNMQTIVLESFDSHQKGTQYGWYAQGSSFIAKGYPKWTYAHAWPEALFGSNPTNPDLRALGINGAFNRQGYNHIDIFPIKEDSNGNIVKDKNGNVIPDPIPIPGQVRTFDLWVWGSNHNFSLEVQLEDYKGVIHVLQLGSLDFAGWKDLLVNVPTSIPQAVETIPKLRGLKLVKFVLWTKPTANVSNFYVYLDQIKVLTDTYQTRIDGQNLANPQRVQQIWSGQGVTQGK